MKKGFTLVELLVTLVIIALLGGLGLVANRTFFNTGKTRYYSTLESGILLAGNDYFLDHRDKLPTENFVEKTEISNLINEKYIEPIKDSDGNICSTGYVYAYLNNNKYNYEVCLECNDGYKSSGKYCKGAYSAIIEVTARTTSGADYNVLSSYNNTLYTNNENVIVTFKMNKDNFEPKRYDVIEVNNGGAVYTSCGVNSEASCYVTIAKSGTYEVRAYDKDNKLIATNQQFNVKISKNGPKYTISGNKRIEISKSECNSHVERKIVTFKIVKENIEEEYKSVKYCIRRLENTNECNKYNDYQSNNSLTINADVGSGAYILRVIVSNFVDEVTTREYDFDVMYDVNLKYADDNTKGIHKVVKGQSYNYLSTKYSDIKALPTNKNAYGINNMEIRWHLDGENYDETRRIMGHSMVTNNCSYTLEGLVPIPVDSPTDLSKYCSNPTYNGNIQSITKNISHVNFITSEQPINAKTYTVRARIDAPNYIWKDTMTFNDKVFDCQILPKTLYVNASPQTKKYGANNPTLTYTKTGEVNGQTAKFEGGLTTSAETLSNVGTYDINQGTLKLVDNQSFKASNYQISYTKSSLVITTRPLSVVAEDKTKYHTQDNPQLTYQYSGEVSGQIPGFTGQLATTAVKNSGIGNYTITKGSLALIDNGTFKKNNYELVFTNGKLTIKDPCINITKSCGNYGSCSKTYSNQQGEKVRTCQDYSRDLQNYKCGSEYTEKENCTGTKDPCESTTQSCSYGTCSVQYTNQTGNKSKTCQNYSSAFPNYKCGSETTSEVSCTGTKDPCESTTSSCSYGTCSVQYTHQKGKQTKICQKYSSVFPNYTCGNPTTTEVECRGTKDPCESTTESCSYGTCSATYTNETGNKSKTCQKYSKAFPSYKCGSETTSEVSCTGETNPNLCENTSAPQCDANYSACSKTYTHEKGTKTRKCRKYSTIDSNHLCEEYDDTVECYGATNACENPTESCTETGCVGATYSHEVGSKTKTCQKYSRTLTNHTCGDPTVTVSSCNGSIVTTAASATIKSNTSTGSYKFYVSSSAYVTAVSAKVSPNEKVTCERKTSERIECTVTGMTGVYATTRAQCQEINDSYIKQKGDDNAIIYNYNAGLGHYCYKHVGNSTKISDALNNAVKTTCGRWVGSWSSNHCDSSNHCRPSIDTAICSTGFSGGVFEQTKNGKQTYHCACYGEADYQIIYSTTVTIYYIAK